MTRVQRSCFYNNIVVSVDTSRIEDGESSRIISKVSTLEPSGFLLPQDSER